MKREFPKLFASVKDVLIAKKSIINNDNQKLAEVGDEFIVEEIVEYGFDLKSMSNPQIIIRLLNSELNEYFILKTTK